MSGRGLLEAILFVSGEPVAVEQLARWMNIPAAEVKRLAEQNEQTAPGLVIRQINGRLQLSTNPELAGELKRIFTSQREDKLSNSLLETLTMVAYRQPITRQEIDDIRGVHSAYALSALQERGLVEKVGTKDVLGRPALYGTTEAFLQRFDLRSLADLPPLTDFEREEAPRAPEEKHDQSS